MYIAPIITHKWGAGNDWKLRVQLCVLGISHKTFGLQCNSLTPIKIYHTPPSPPLPIIPSGGGRANSNKDTWLGSLGFLSRMGLNPMFLVFQSMLYLPVTNSRPPDDNNRHAFTGLWFLHGQGFSSCWTLQKSKVKTSASLPWRTTHSSWWGFIGTGACHCPLAANVIWKYIIVVQTISCHWLNHW